MEWELSSRPRRQPRLLRAGGLGSLTCPLPPQLSGGCELTVVIHDFTACNSTELTIRRGQTVEVLERPHDKPDWCLVRTTDRSPAVEGLVPCGSLCIAHSRSSMEMEGIFNHKGRSSRAWMAMTVLLEMPSASVPASCSLIIGTIPLGHSCPSPLSLCLRASLIHLELRWNKDFTCHSEIMKHRLISQGRVIR